MVNKPSTVDEALAYVWSLPETALRLSEKQSIAAALAEKIDTVPGGTFPLQIQNIGWGR